MGRRDGGEEERDRSREEMEKEREKITNSSKTLGFEYIHKQTMERRREDESLRICYLL